MEYVLFVWQYDTVILLDCHGGCVEEMRSSKDLAETLMNSDVQWDDGKGVYLAEVSPFRIDYPAGDCDVGLRGTARLATAAELKAFVADEYWHNLGQEPSVSVGVHVAEPGEATEISYVGYDRQDRPPDEVFVLWDPSDQQFCGGPYHDAKEAYALAVNGLGVVRYVRAK